MVGFINASTPGNGGLAAGMKIAEYVQNKKKEEDKLKGLASGFLKVRSGDDSGWDELANADPNVAMNMWKAQKALDQKNIEVPTNIKELQYIQNHPELKELYLQSRRGININNNLTPFEKKRIENAASKIDENIAKANERIAMYDRGSQLLDNGVETGGIVGYAKKNWLPTSALSPETQEFQSLVSKLVPQQRPAGSGTTSDRDMAIYEKATIGLDKDTKTNKNILALGKAMAENDKAYEELRAEWASSGRSLAEFDKIWRKYANEQRIYNDDGTINKDRIDPYDWFANGGSLQQEQPKNESKKSKYVIEEIIE